MGIEMAKKMTARTIRKVSASMLTQRDADRIKGEVKRFSENASSSKAKARNALISLGIYTQSGKLSKRYG